MPIETTSFRSLDVFRLSESIRQQLGAGNACEFLDLGKVFHGHRFPLTDCARVYADAQSQTGQTPTFLFEVCCQLFHNQKLVALKFLVKLIFSVSAWKARRKLRTVRA